MTKNMENFAELMQNAENGRDIGINFLRKNIHYSSNVKGKLFGCLGIAYNELEIDDIAIDLNNPVSSEIYVDKRYPVIYRYVERYRVLDVENLNKESDGKNPFNKGVLKEGFDIIISYLMLIEPLYGSGKYKILLQKEADVFVVTKYGCYDILKEARNSVSISYAIEKIFKDSHIRVCPSTSSSSKFNKQLSSKLEEAFIIDKGINPKIRETVKLSISYKPIKSYKYNYDNFSETDAADVFVDGKFLCCMKSETNTDVEVTVKTNIGKTVKFVSSIDTYALNARISSSLLSKYILIREKNDGLIDTSIVKGIKIIESDKDNYGSIKNKYYSLFVHANTRNLYKLRRSIMYNLGKNVSFTKLKNRENLLNNTLLIQKLSENTVFETDNYTIALYNYYNNRKLFIPRSIVAVYLIEEKRSKNIYLLSVYYSLLQISIGTNNCFLMELPMLFYYPYISEMGNDNYNPSSFCDNIVYKNPILNKIIYDTILNEFGNMRLKLTPNPKVHILESDFLFKSFNKDVDMTLMLGKEDDDKGRNIKQFTAEFVDGNDKYIGIDFITQKFDDMIISDFLKEHKSDFYIADTLLSCNVIEYLQNSSE